MKKKLTLWSALALLVTAACDPAASGPDRHDAQEELDKLLKLLDVPEGGAVMVSSSDPGFGVRTETRTPGGETLYLTEVPGAQAFLLGMFTLDVPEDGAAILTADHSLATDVGVSGSLNRSGGVLYRATIDLPDDQYATLAWAMMGAFNFQDPEDEEDDRCLFTDYQNPPTWRGILGRTARSQELRAYGECLGAITAKVEDMNKGRSDDEKCFVMDMPEFNEDTGVSDMHAWIMCPE